MRQQTSNNQGSNCPLIFWDFLKLSSSVVVVVVGCYRKESLCKTFHLVCYFPLRNKLPKFQSAFAQFPPTRHFSSSSGKYEHSCSTFQKGPANAGSGMCLRLHASREILSCHQTSLGIFQNLFNLNGQQNVATAQDCI